MDGISASSNAATEHIGHHIRPQTWAPKLEHIRHWRSVRSDQRSIFLASTCYPTASPLSLRPPCSLNLKVFHLFLSLVSYIYGLMGMSFSLRLSVSLFLYLKTESKWESLSLFETLFEILSDCLTLPYRFINICPCFWLYPLVLVRYN